MKKSYTILLSFIFTFLASCNNKVVKSSKENISNQEKSVHDAVKNNTDSTTKLQPSNGRDEVMLEKDIIFNGKHRRFFTLTEFENIYGKADSTKFLDELEPCTYIFDTETENTSTDDNKYYYKDSTQFEIYKQKAAVDNFRFCNNNYIIYKGIKLDQSSTVLDLSKLFPNSVNNISTIDVYNEGELQMIILMEDDISDGHIRIFFKNGKLYAIHWWFPC